MGQQTNEVKAAASAGARVKKAVLAALALTAAIMAAGYAGLCAWAGSRTTFYPKETISGVNVGGLTVEQAGQVLAGSLPGRTLSVSTVQTAEAEGWISSYSFQVTRWRSWISGLISTKAISSP